MGRTVELRTEIPGPRSRAIGAQGARRRRARRRSWVPVVDRPRAQAARSPTSTATPSSTSSGGIGCLNVGHSNPRVDGRRARTQVERFLHTDFTIVPYESYVELAERLWRARRSPGRQKAAFFNCGAEAVENAVKIARAATGRQAVIAFEGAFHGRTLMAMSLTSKQHPYKAGLRARSRPRSTARRSRTPYRWPGPTPPASALDDAAADADHARRRRERGRDHHRAGAGRGRLRRPAAEYLRGLREICDEHGIVLIADEVQTGFGRTGKLFAIEHFGVEPDLVMRGEVDRRRHAALRRARRAEIMDAPARLARSAAPTSATRWLRRRRSRCSTRSSGEGLLDRGGEIGDRHPRRATRRCRSACRQIGDVRGLGPMLGMEFVARPGDEAARRRSSRRASSRQALQRGLILLKAGVVRQLIRMLVPLVVTDEQLDEALDILSAAVQATCGSKPLAATPAT